MIESILELQNLQLFCGNENTFYVKDHKKDIKYEKNNNYCLEECNVKYSDKFSQKKKIVHIIGVFYSGGIERLCYYIDKYGSHEKYEMVLCYIGMEKVFYEIQKMSSFDYQGNMVLLNEFLVKNNPDLIIDHCSIYLNENSVMYNGIKKEKIITFVHSAICYKKDISSLIIEKCINLYNEIDKHKSWSNKVKQNNYVMLGAELLSDEKKSRIVNSKSSFKSKKKLKIGIIGRICNEKVPLSFLEKCVKFTNKHKKFEINFYGEKKNPFELDYEKKFDNLIEGSRIIYNGFMDPTQMDSIYSDIDVLMIPSVYETGSFVCIEAFAYGIPVLARNVYGLKYLIENDKNGFLVDSDEEFFESLKNLIDAKGNISSKIESMRNYIFDNCQYNIVDKIRDLENIFLNEIGDKTSVLEDIIKNELNENYKVEMKIEKTLDYNRKEKNVFLITSIITPSEKPLSYYNLRSVFTPEQRYLQTLKSISSIRNYYPDAIICWIEGSEIQESMENEVKQKVEFYINIFEDNKDFLSSEFKGLGERILILKGLEFIFEQQKIKHFDFNLYKLSGRYYLNSTFDIHTFGGEKSTFKMWEDHKSFTSIFYKIVSKDIQFFYQVLEEGYDFLAMGKSMEECLYKGFFINTFNHINTIDKCNVCGYLSTEGYFFTV